MKKLILLLLLLTPVIGFSQTDVFGNARSVASEQWGVHRTFPGTTWRDKLPFERSTQDKIGEIRGRNQNRTYRIGRNPSNIHKMKWKKWNRQRKRAYKRINVWG